MNPGIQGLAVAGKACWGHRRRAGEKPRWAVGQPSLGAVGISCPQRGFTLIELLTVIFIISLLIAILLPSLSRARNSAKKTSTLATFNALKVALESFKTDNERDFAATNGYPPSYVHPPIGTLFTQEDGLNGRFPFLAMGAKPRVYGAHWLPAMLMGVDALGLVKRESVPQSLKGSPWEWYKPMAYNNKPLDRTPLYVDASGLRLVATEAMTGQKVDAQFPDWNVGDENFKVMRQLPVITDPFGQAILYYAANRFGKATNHIECAREANGNYGPKGQPYYFHEDNAGFTGETERVATNVGWGYSGAAEHWIAKCGNLVTAENMERPEYQRTFARFIHDRTALAAIPPEARTATTPVKPSNPDSYLLISAGVDGIYGSGDDVTNFTIKTAE